MNNSPKKTPMAMQTPEARCRNFSEVALGYSPEEAVSEAQRCLNCKNHPCTEGCPVSVSIPAFISRVRERDFGGAYDVLSASTSLPAVCGRVCPQESQCEKFCVRGGKGEPVAIGRLERFVADAHAGRGSSPAPATNGHKVSVVGSGPAGLSCAGTLARMGYKVTVFEALHALGGVLVYGIPAFRLPKDIVAREIEELRALGVEFVTDAVIGRTYTVSELKEDFDAVFLGTGAGLPIFPGIKGEMKAYEENSETPVFRGKQVAVVGGGNVAMDAARTARRLGGDVTVLYRRSEAELPARKEEIAHAKEEGVAFRWLTAPKEILTDAEENVTGVLCVRMELGAPDASGRCRPTEVEGSDHTVQADMVIFALGTSPNPLLKRTTEGLATGAHGEIVADGDGKTSLDKVYAGGDAVTGSATVILAMGAGKRAAEAIDRELREI